MSLRQLAETVCQGRQITFSLFDEDPVTGYLAGIDLPPFPEKYFVLEPYGPHRDRFHRKIVRDLGNPLLHIHPTADYADEPAFKEMEKIIHPFRMWLANNIVNRNDAEIARKVAS